MMAIGEQWIPTSTGGLLLAKMRELVAKVVDSSAACLRHNQQAPVAEAMHA